MEKKTFLCHAKEKIRPTNSLTKNWKLCLKLHQELKLSSSTNWGVEESEVTNEASFTNDLGADSLDTVELIMEFEKEFNVTIPDDQAEKITTVGDAVAYIEANAK